MAHMTRPMRRGKRGHQAAPNDNAAGRMGSALPAQAAMRAKRRYVRYNQAQGTV